MKKKVLIVDDEEEIIAFMERFLKRLKISSICATSGEQAIALYDKKEIGFVFLDIKMGGMDGLTALEKIRQIDPEVKAIIITGNVSSSFTEKAKSLGALDYITKPLDLSEFKAKVDKYIINDTSQ
ncbi:response regulator [Elusimicrobiota bacterium]